MRKVLHAGPMDKPRIREIIDIIEETQKVKTFIVIDEEISKKGKPGQFAMLWVPKSEEIPISISNIQGNEVWFTVSRVGETTKKLHKMRRGDLIGVRGPYGNSFDLNYKEIIVVGGGYGIAPLAFAAETAKKNNSKIYVFIGAKTRSELIFIERLKKTTDKLYISTDDGTMGFKGFVTDLFLEKLDNGIVKGETILTCGPEAMIYKVYKIGESYNINVQASLERYMMCGIGICGSCALGRYRVCIDGPVFNMQMLKEVEDWIKK